MLNLNNILNEIERVEYNAREARNVYQRALSDKEVALVDIMQEMVKDSDLVPFLKIDVAKMRKEMGQRNRVKRHNPEF